MQLALADVPNQQPGCSPLGFTKSQESDCRVLNSKFTSSLKKNGPLILMESVITHEGALGSLLTQSTQLMRLHGLITKHVPINLVFKSQGSVVQLHVTKISLAMRTGMRKMLKLCLVHLKVLPNNQR